MFMEHNCTDFGMDKEKVSYMMLLLLHCVFVNLFSLRKRMRTKYKNFLVCANTYSV